MSAPKPTEPNPHISGAIEACRGLAGWALVFSAGINLLYLSPSIFMLQVYDRVLQTGGLATLGFISVALLVALATLALVDAMRSRLFARLSMRLDRVLAPVLLNISLRRNAGPQARQQLMREFDTLRQAIVGPSASSLLDAPWAPLFVIVCFIIHPVIGVLTALGGAALFGLAFLAERAQRKSINRASEEAPRLYAAQESDAANAEVVRALGMETAIVARQLKAREGLNSLQADSIFSSTSYAAGTRFLRLALQSATLAVGAWLAIDQQISPGAMIAATILAARALAPLEQLVGAWRQIGQARAAYNTIVSTLSSAAALERPHTTLPAPSGGLRFERVGLRLPGLDRPVLLDVSFQIAPGEAVGVIGPSGAGKSTLARVAAGAIAPEVGVVRLDGSNLADWPASELGRYVGYLPQDIALLAGTVADNIARFSRHGGEEDAALVDAAKQAGAHILVQRLPHGYDTHIDLGGRGLSLGQAQRIALARALYRDPPLLVLDEPNSHLDAEGEAALMEALKRAKARGASILVVAHRAGILAMVDRLMVLRDGRIEAIGPRDEIMRKIAGGEGSVAPLRPREVAP